jgi:hypothetical protein
MAADESFTFAVTVPMLVCHIVSSGTGLLILHHFFRSTMYYIVGFAVGAYLCLFLVSHLLKRHRGPILGMASVLFLIVWWVVLSLKNFIQTWNHCHFHMFCVCTHVHAHMHAYYIHHVYQIDHSCLISEYITGIWVCMQHIYPLSSFFYRLV